MSMENYPSLGRVRYADIDIDGYPDILITLTLKNTKTKNISPQSFILGNIACSEEESDCEKDQDDKRYF